VIAVKGKVNRARARLRESGWRSLIGWGLRWLFWRGQIYRLVVWVQAANKLWRRDPRRRLAPAVVVSVQDWCAAQGGAAVTILHDAETIRRNPPATLEPEVHPAFLEQLTYQNRPKYLVPLRDARIAGPNGAVILPDGSFSQETANGRYHLERDPTYYAGLPRRQRQKSGDYFSFMMMWANTGNYYHWLHDVLLKFYLVAEHLPANIQYIVPVHLLPYQVDSLHLLGISEQQWVRFDEREVWDLENLYYTAPTTWSGHDLPEADSWLRDQLMTDCGIAGGGHQRLYLSRRQAQSRRIVNEAEVEACLRAYGFETCVAEDLSLCAQIELFAQAQMVVSSHGAGLTNVLFADPGLTLIEIFEPSYLHYVYWSLCEALGHRYWYMLGQAVPNERFRLQSPHVAVPLDKLERTLKRALAGS
jgi:capsular polysaccharide biosynthesis protein